MIPITLILIFHFLKKKESSFKRKSHILIGPTEIANNVYSMSRAFHKKGYQVTTIVHRNNYYQNNLYDFILSKKFYLVSIQKAVLFFKFVTKANFFLYFWRYSYLPFHLDYLFLKIINKKIIIQHCGDDVRYRPFQRKIDILLQNHSVWKENDLKGFIFFTISFWTQRIPEIINLPIVTLRDQATFQTKPAYHFFIPQKKLLENPKTPKSKPLIIHAPTERKMKGTDIVIKSIKKLKEKNRNFKFEFIYKKTNQYVLERLAEADIVIDQPNAWCGRLAIEAMASSCAIIGGNRAEYHQFNIKSPVLQFEPDNVEYLVSKLDILILNQSFRGQKMRESYIFWKKYYTEEKIVHYLEEIFFKQKDPTLMPIPNIKKHLLKFSENYYQKLHIKFM